MKLVKFGTRQAVLLASGAQVLFEREKPLVARSGGGKWYRRADATPSLVEAIDKYLRNANCGPEVYALDAEEFTAMIETF